jgi:hypothetical protein
MAATDLRPTAYFGQGRCDKRACACRREVQVERPDTVIIRAPSPEVWAILSQTSPFVGTSVGNHKPTKVQQLAINGTLVFPRASSCPRTKRETT